MTAPDIDYRGRIVLVTGAGGFIGSHVVARLVAAGARVRALVRYSSHGGIGHLEETPPDALSSIEIVRGDIRDAGCLRRAAEGADVIIHLAALIGIPYSYVAPGEYVAVNVQGTLNVLEAARAARVSRVVHISTSEVYGTAQYRPIDEKHPQVGQSPYSASKIGADKMAESFHRSFGTPVTIVRPFNTFGPRQSRRAVIPTILSQLLGDCERLRIGSLEPVRDMTYVGDTAEGILQVGACGAAVGEQVNLGTGRAISVGDIARACMEIVGRDVPIERDEARVRPPASEVMALVSDNRKAAALAGWAPKVAFREGLIATCDYLRARAAKGRAGEYVI